MVDHKKGKSAIGKSNGFTRSHNGNIVPKINTHGWKLYVDILVQKHNFVFYFRIQVSQKAGTIRVGWFEGEYNKSDIETKTTISTKM